MSGLRALRGIRSSPALAGEEDHAKRGGGGESCTSLPAAVPAFGGTPPATRGESRERAS
jgi:hypothetical protein